MQLVFVALPEDGVLELPIRWVSDCLVEVVHVQLPHKGLDVAMLEVLRQHLCNSSEAGI